MSKRRGRYHRYFKTSASREIKTRSSAVLLRLFQKLEKRHGESGIRFAILNELEKREKGIGGPHGNWGHG